MKDEYKRRRRAERPLIRTLSEDESGLVFTPTEQECLNMDGSFGYTVATAGNNFIATSTGDWLLEVYELDKNDDQVKVARDEFPGLRADGLKPERKRNSVWHAVAFDIEHEKPGNIVFIDTDVIACVQTNPPGLVSTWHVHSGHCLASVTLRGVHFREAACKISKTEFVVGSEEGHLCILMHEGGCNLKESSRIWKAHPDLIISLSYHKNTLVSTSEDWTAQLWDAKTKKRLAVLKHDWSVFDAAISDEYIVTCSLHGKINSIWENGEIRIYHNSEGYALAKILRSHEHITRPILLDDDRILCLLKGLNDSHGLPLVGNSLAVIDISSESVLARLNVGCRFIWDYLILGDERLAVVGHGECSGIIATLPSRFRAFIKFKTAMERKKPERRRMCAVM